MAFRNAVEMLMQDLTIFGTLGIDTTGRRIARLDDFYWSGCCFPVALYKWIANKAFVADTYWYMISHVTLGIDATETRTRILTLSVDTSFVNWAILVYDTLRSTVWW